MIYNSELYEAARWNTDPRFQAPMTTLSDGTRLFLEDFVEIENGYGKIKKFVIEVTFFSYSKNAF